MQGYFAIVTIVLLVTMVKTYRIKFIIIFAIQILVFMFPVGDFAYGMDFNDDIQKVAINYNYYDGFGDDKVVQSVRDGSWHILKPDGSLINLKGNYLDYAGIDKGEYYNYDEEYYSFVVAIDNNLTRFGFVDKNGTEWLVEGYSFADPTMSDKYWLLMNVDSDTNYKFGLYDRYNNKEVIPVVYDELLYLDDERIIVRNGEKAGIIDITQKIITPFQYNFLQYINDNFIIALNSDKHGIININNEVVLPFEYDEIHKVSETNNYCRIIKNDKFGLVNADNAELVIPIDYESLYYVDEIYIGDELIVAKKDGKSGIIDVKNKVIVPFIYDGIELIGNCFEVYKDGLAGLLDTKGNEILPAEAIDIMEVKEGSITARVYIDDYDHKYAVYDMEGNEIVPPIYDYINYHASEKFMIVNNDGVANLVNKLTGEAVLTKSYYSDIWYINDKYFAGGNNSYYSIINFSGQQLTPPYYSNVSIVNVGNEELLAAECQTSKKFNRKIDYFKQTNGPSIWAREEVAKAIENNLVPFEYQAAFTFNIKRYEFCSIIVAFLEEYYDTTREDIITTNNIDVVNPPIVDGFNEDVAICLHLGIINGRGNGIFDGESEITREEAAVMLTNLAKSLGLDRVIEERYINDKSEISPWAKDAVNFVLQNRIMQGVGYGMFSPKSNLTREQIYIIMYRMLNAIQIAKTDGATLLADKKTENCMYKGFTVQTENKSQTFSWVNVTNPTYNPTISIADVDGDGKDEIIIILITGYGTGVHLEEIHILNLEDLTELNIEDPFEAIKNRVSSSIITNDDKVNIIIKWNGKTLEKSFDKSYAGWWFDKISFNSVIHHEIENNRIIVKVSGQMSPAGFPVTAVLEYDENLKVINIEIEDNEIK